MMAGIARLAIAVLWGMWAAAAGADPLNDAIVELQHEWAKGYYSTPEKQQKSYFAALQAKAHQVTEKFPGRAEPLIWEGIITSTHAKYQSIFSAGGTAKAARDLLLAAEKIDPNALDGSALTSLGSLYYKVPRFGSFGDHDKARDYLERALRVNPDGIDPNFFYGEFLLERGEKNKAAEYLKKALAAPPRPGREDADEGRRAEIRQTLQKAEGR
jgi:tetratricopeptide (TPR) repeat protein